jgi:hypothetical protein
MKVKGSVFASIKKTLPIICYVGWDMDSPI